MHPAIIGMTIENQNVAAIFFLLYMVCLCHGICTVAEEAVLDWEDRV